MSENPQHFENPLHWVQLFSRGIYYIPDDTIPDLNQVELPAEPVAVLPTEPVAVLPAEPVVESTFESPVPIINVINKNSQIGVNIVTPQGLMDKPTSNDTTEQVCLFPVASDIILANIFMDEVDGVFLEDVAFTFQRLLSALKVGDQIINPDQIANYHQPNAIFSKIKGFSKEASFFAPFTIFWSDQILEELPEMYQIIGTSKGSSLRLPSFNTMIGSEALKRKCWQCMLKILALNKTSGA